MRAGGAEDGFGGGVEHCEHAAAGGAGRSDADGGVLDGETFGGGQVETCCGEQIGLGVGLGIGDVVAGDHGGEERREVERVEDGDDFVSARAGADCEGEACGVHGAEEREGDGVSEVGGVGEPVGDVVFLEALEVGEEGFGEEVEEGSVFEHATEGLAVAVPDEAGPVGPLGGLGEVEVLEGVADGGLVDGLGVEDDAVEIGDEGAHGGTRVGGRLRGCQWLLCLMMVRVVWAR